MADDDRILTLHPAGKQGVRIERAKYDEMRRVLLAVVPRGGDGIRLKDLPDVLAERLDPAIHGPGVSLLWYLTTVKQDLEARGELEIVPGKRPQHLRRPASRR